MYKLFFCDIDETLLGLDYQIPTRNKEAIFKAMEKGVKFIPCSGRGHHSIESVTKQLGIYEKENEYIVSYNGGMIVENKGYREILFEGLDDSLCERIFNAAKQYDVCIQVFTSDNCYVFNVTWDELELKHKKQGKFVLVEEMNMEFLKKERIVKIILHHLDMEYLHTIEKDLNYISEGVLEVSYSSNRYLEYNRKGINKGSSMLYLAKYLKVKPEEIIAIGDNLNDLSMIELAGLGCSVLEGKDELKRIADYITETSYQVGAVAEVIEKFILKEDLCLLI